MKTNSCFLMGPVILVIWPILSFGIFCLEGSVINDIPSLRSGGGFHSFFVNLPNSLTVILAISIIFSCILAAVGSFSNKRKVRYFSRFYCCLCLISPGVIGTEGFGVPVPLIFALIVGFTHLQILKSSLWFYAITLLLFLIVAVFFLIYLFLILKLENRSKGNGDDPT